MKLAELKARFEELTGHQPIKVAVLLWLQNNGLLGVDNPVEFMPLSKKSTWEALIDIAEEKQAIGDMDEPEQLAEDELEKSDVFAANPALTAIAIEEPIHQNKQRVMSRQTPVLEAIEEVEVQPAPPKKKGRKVSPRIKSYAINGKESNDFLFQQATYKLQVIGNSVALFRYANSQWRMYDILGSLTELKFDNAKWYVLANGNKDSRKIANEIYHNPGASRDRLAREYNVVFKTFDIPNGLIEYVQSSEVEVPSYDDNLTQNKALTKMWSRKVVTLKRVSKERTEYQFFPKNGICQKSKLHKLAVEKTEQWLKYLSTNELTGIPVRFKFKKKRKNGSYKYVSVNEEVVNVYKTLQMLVQGKRGKNDLGYYLVKADMSDWSEDELKQLAHQIAITGDRTNTGYLKCLSWSGCPTSEQLVWRVLEGCHKLFPPLAFVDDDNKKIKWNDSITTMKNWLDMAKSNLPEYAKLSFNVDTINTFYHWLRTKAETNLSYEYKFKVISLFNSCPVDLLEYYGNTKIKDFLTLSSNVDPTMAIYTISDDE